MSFLVVSLQYTVKRDHRDAYLEAVKTLRDNALNLGAVDYLVLEDDAKPNLFTELIVYDGWVQYDNARRSPPTRAVEAVFKQMEDWIEGGSEAADVQFRKTVLGGW